MCLVLSVSLHSVVSVHHRRSSRFTNSLHGLHRHKSNVDEASKIIYYTSVANKNIFGGFGRLCLDVWVKWLINVQFKWTPVVAIYVSRESGKTKKMLWKWNVKLSGIKQFALIEQIWHCLPYKSLYLIAHHALNNCPLMERNWGWPIQSAPNYCSQTDSAQLSGQCVLHQDS